MKKLFLIFAVCAFSLTTFAQDDAMKTKKGFVILPEAGDYVLGFDAVPVLDYASNVADIMGSAAVAKHPGYVTGMNNIIVGKYFVTDKKAYRVRFGINTTKTTTKTFGDNPLFPSKVGTVDAENILISTTKTGNAKYFLAAGLELRRGHNRLQGFYGGEFLFGYATTNTTNKYEIEYNKSNIDSTNAGSTNLSRNLSTKSGGAITIGLRGFTGVEYFVLPKISIGAEFGWGLGVTTTPRGKTNTEVWSIPAGATAAVQSEIEAKGNTSSKKMGFAVDNGISNILGGSAAVTINFHF